MVVLLCGDDKVFADASDDKVMAAGGKPAIWPSNTRHTRTTDITGGPHPMNPLDVTADLADRAAISAFATALPCARAL